MNLAVDLGSTSVKAALFDPVGDQRGTGVQVVPYVQGPAGQVEIDPESLSQCIRKAIASALADAGAVPGDLPGVAITGQAQTFAWADELHHPLHRFISWQDGRAGDAAGALTRSPDLADFPHHASPGSILPALMCSQIARMNAEGRPRGHRLLTLSAWLHAMWTGTAVLDDNQAAMTGLYSLQDLQWWAPMLRTLGLDPHHLPVCSTVGEISGTTTPAAESWGLPVGIPVLLAGNDQTAGAVGADLENQGGILITLGTAQVVYQWQPERPPPDPGRFRGPYPGGGFYRMMADSLGGNVVNGMQSWLQGCESDEAFFAAAQAATADGPVFAYEDRSGTFDLQGLTPAHGPGHIARAGLTFLVERLASRMKADGFPLGNTVLVAGGGSQQPLWRDLLAQRLGVSCCPTVADPLRGAARMLQAKKI